MIVKSCTSKSRKIEIFMFFVFRMILKFDKDIRLLKNMLPTVRKNF